MVSIIIPFFNAERYLNDCLSSIINQTYNDFEVICINDGSTDSSASICERFVKKDNRFKLLYQTNSGVSVARNKGVEIAKGEFCCFIDADDMVDCRFLEVLVSKIQNRDLVICDYTRKTKLGLGGKKDIIIKPDTLIQKILLEKIKHPNIVCFLYRKHIIDDNNIKFVEGCVKNEDTEFYLKYLSYCISHIIITDYIGYFYRVNDNSATQSPISLKSLTSIEASRRIGLFLAEKGFIDDPKLDLSNGILTYTYYTAKQKNVEIYNFIHNNYDVQEAMIKMRKFPSMRKKMVAYTYSLLGKSVFFHFISHLK